MAQTRGIFLFTSHFAAFLIICSASNLINHDILETSEEKTTTTELPLVDTTLCFNNMSHADSNRLCFHVEDANVGKLYTEKVNSTIEMIYTVLGAGPTIPLTLNIHSDDPLLDKDSLIVLARIGTSQYPLELPYSTRQYRSVGRAICPLNSTGLTKPKHGHRMQLSFNTMSRTNISFTFSLNRTDTFNLPTNKILDATISPWQTELVHFNLSSSLEEYLFQAESSDDSCLSISAHSACESIMEALSNPGYNEGIRATMTRKAGIIIQRDKFPNGLYILFKLHEDGDLCSSHPNVSLPTTTPTKKVTFQLKEMVSMHDRGLVFFAWTPGLILVVAIVAVGCAVAIIHFANKSSDDVDLINIPDNEDDPLIGRADDEIGITPEVAERTNKQSKLFAKQLFVVALFYAHPVFRMVYTYMQVMTETGNEDLCFYNTLCTLSFFSVPAFNHIFSNIGYVVFGMVHFAIVFFQERSYTRKFKENPHGCVQRGVPIRFAFQYAMGLAMIVQGIFSALYHICPTRDSFEFDTAFMYVLATFCMLHLYCARSVKRQIEAHSMFIAMGVVILHTALTFLHDAAYFKVYFAVAHLVGYNIVATEFYYRGDIRWKPDPRKVMEYFKDLWRTRARPEHLDRLAVVVFGNAANIALSGVEWLSTTLDFNTYILLIFVVNLLAYSTFYIYMKFQHNESVLKPSFAIVYFSLSVATWVGALVFFSRKVSSWEGSAAESRVYNEDCVVGGVYDTHDMWHFLSSLGLFFFVQFLLFLDNDVAKVAQSEIAVF